MVILTATQRAYQSPVLERILALGLNVLICERRSHNLCGCRIYSNTHRLVRAGEMLDRTLNHGFDMPPTQHKLYGLIKLIFMYTSNLFSVALSSPHQNCRGGNLPFQAVYVTR